MKKDRTITLIGAGRLAQQLGPAVEAGGYQVGEVYSRNRKRAEDLLGNLYQAEVIDTLDFSESASGIFIISVSDDAIETMAEEIILPDEAVLIHTSGRCDMEVLRHSGTPHIGVLYPLQTFAGNYVDFEPVPLFIEAGTEYANTTITTLAKSISRQVYRLDTAARRTLHLAAVFASNFTNHMLTQAKAIMEEQGLDYRWLKPLVAETIDRGLQGNPTDYQTGPAARGDLQTLEAHLSLLQDQPDMAELYTLISQHIQSAADKKN